MIFLETKLKDAYIIQLQPIADERGFFSRTWCKNEFEKHGLKSEIVQCNLSYNEKKGTLRGMHYQVEPYRETKLIRCIKGAFYDVIIDLRKKSHTYKQWIGVELTENNNKSLYVPEGFAHGFQTLVDDTYAFYQVTEFYTPGAERGIRWNDPQFKIQWPEEKNRIISAKDQSLGDYRL
ncbi:dTDP-4-dehydrorhamnose 3,5-epimerase [Clostridium autoethanogenum]|uniref:dTDP-4-dehydrorhamnose 3,5-epimerase n=1 Tax=Clostridium autoethanogenum TaxID=84023 RepID=A0A3M0T134_9CLOT|nr:dTDP-4-dehydrorhamnose 3,5-epimerase [Clostridium autoethanogenum]RMD04340.1 dTDP-4-dehydrorhamnose 3,5-epimerase [Clostridium autoethanogenum]